ncbi:hypothetical protein [Streptomyces sp. NPDC059994]|uniref:hypothetical protein n=1 Tax=Streptomyces sp. NPDC059994 TaxID=3347029 RepID=UPI0036ACE907
MNQVNAGRVAVIAVTGADMDISSGLTGSVRIGRTQGRRIKVIACHRVTSVSVSPAHACTSGGAWRASIRASRAPLEPTRC